MQLISMSWNSLCHFFLCGHFLCKNFLCGHFLCFLSLLCLLTFYVLSALPLKLQDPNADITWSSHKWNSTLFLHIFQHISQWTSRMTKDNWRHPMTRNQTNNQWLLDGPCSVSITPGVPLFFSFIPLILTALSAPCRAFSCTHFSILAGGFDLASHLSHFLNKKSFFELFFWIYLYWDNRGTVRAF